MSDVIYDYFKLCEDVMILDQNIRFAGIINERGRLVAGGLRKKNIPLVDEKFNEILFMELALRVRMRKDFDEQLGKVQYSMTVRENNIGMSFPIKTDFLYVAVGSRANQFEIINKILALIVKKHE